MSAFTYKATLGLISGHTLNTNYSIDVKIKTYTPNDVVNGIQQISGSKSETIINDVVLSHKFQTIPLDWTNYLSVREFLLSAMDGQLITFDVSGTVAVPVNPITGKLKFNKKLQPTEPAHGYYAFNFEILELT